VRLPQNQGGTINKLKKEISKLEQKLERPPTIEEIAAVMDLPDYKVVELLRMNTHSQSMDATISPDEDTKFIDTFISNTNESTDQILIQESMNQDVEKILAVLPEQERDILKMCFGIGEPHEYTLEEIGNRFDISRERVRQIKERALKRLRAEQNALKNKTLANAFFS
jgi:RNA polymerase primary sigma factor